MKADKNLILITSEPSTRKRLYRTVRALPEGEYAVQLIQKRARVAPGQRGYYWGYLLVEVARLIGKSREEADTILNALFLVEQWTVAGEAVSVVLSLSDLNPIAASDYFAKIRMWVWSKYKVRLTEPDPAKRTVAPK